MLKSELPGLGSFLCSILSGILRRMYRILCLLFEFFFIFFFFWLLFIIFQCTKHADVKFSERLGTEVILGVISKVMHARAHTQTEERKKKTDHEQLKISRLDTCSKTTFRSLQPGGCVHKKSPVQYSP